MTDIKCPYDDSNKSYVIPTKSWLKALEQLNGRSPNDINTKGSVIISELLNKMGYALLVKITSGKSAKLRDINNQIKGLPNMVYTYCVILCNDYLPVILKKKYYCSIKEGFAHKYKATLEIMKFYKEGSLLEKTKVF